MSVLNWTAVINFSAAFRVYQTTTTVQVVSSPLLDRTLSNGRPNPIHDAAWSSLKALEADHVVSEPHRNPCCYSWSATLESALLTAQNARRVSFWQRFQPWFPFPKKAIAELYPPDVANNVTHWDFDGFLPQFTDFVAATDGHPVNLNVAAHPCWLFADWLGRALKCPPPASADTQDLKYGSKANRNHLVDPTGDQVAAYFSRVFAYISAGVFR